MEVKDDFRCSQTTAVRNTVKGMINIIFLDI